MVDVMRVLVFYNGIQVEVIRFKKKLDALLCLFNLLDMQGKYKYLPGCQQEKYDKIKNDNDMFALVMFMRLRTIQEGEVWKFIETIKAK